MVLELRRQVEELFGGYPDVELEIPDFELVSSSTGGERDGGSLPAAACLCHIPVQPDEGNLRVQDMAEDRGGTPQRVRQ